MPVHGDVQGEAKYHKVPKGQLKKRKGEERGRKKALNVCACKTKRKLGKKVREVRGPA